MCELFNMEVIFNPVLLQNTESRFMSLCRGLLKVFWKSHPDEKHVEPFET